jgi:hypothetical protein
MSVLNHRKKISVGYFSLLIDNDPSSITLLYPEYFFKPNPPSNPSHKLTQIRGIGF